MYAAGRSVRTETCGPAAPLSAEPNPSAGQMSTFTSIGATPDLRIKPELSAVGGNVYSSIPTVEGKGDYASMSGTFMASPYVAGASVLVKSYMAENWTSSNADVASVDGSGLVTAKAPGVTTVTATTANGASVSCVVGVSDQLTYTGLRLDFGEMTTTMYFDSTIDLPGVYLEPYGFALSGKHNTYGTDGLTWSISDPTIADLDEYSKTTLVANKGVKTGDSGVLLYMGLMLLALTGSAWVLRKKRAR